MGHFCNELIFLRMCATVRDKKCVISHLMQGQVDGQNLCPTLFHTVKPKRRGRSLLYRTCLKLPLHALITPSTLRPESTCEINKNSKLPIRNFILIREIKINILWIYE